MTTRTLYPPRTEARQAGNPAPWLGYRVVLLTMLAVLTISTLVMGTRPAQLHDLTNALASGQVTEVEIYGLAPDGYEGNSLAQIVWHDGFMDRITEVMQVSQQDSEQGSYSDPDIATVEGSLLDLLSAYSDDVHVTDHGYRTFEHGSAIFGWRVPGWILVGSLLLGTLIMCCVGFGPEPHYATRWAWFWLIISSLGVAALIGYLVFGLRRTDRGDHSLERRLTGGWAFLVMLLLSSAI